MKCCDITSGMLRTSVTFQRRTRVSDGAGGFTETWAAISGANTKALVKSTSGYERYSSGRVEARAQLRASVRYFSGLMESDRVVINSMAHNIAFIDNVELRNIWLVLDLEAGVPS